MNHDDRRGAVFRRGVKSLAGHPEGAVTHQHERGRLLAIGKPSAAGIGNLIVA